MTDSKKLKEVIERSGLKYKAVAEQLNLSPYGLQKKINNINEFKVSEMEKICSILGIDKQERDAIFFSQNSD